MTRTDIIDTLANIIRKVDGNHKLGAGALAEAIVAEVEGMIAGPHITSAAREAGDVPEPALRRNCWSCSRALGAARGCTALADRSSPTELYDWINKTHTGTQCPRDVDGCPMWKPLEVTRG